jgi:TrmH family RNA methyltransferase
VPAASPVTSVKSDRVTAIRALWSRSGRRKAGWFLVEGPQAVRSALAAGVRIHELFVDLDAGGGMSDIVASADEAGTRIVGVTAAVMAAMCQTEHPQGVLAVCPLLEPVDLSELMSGTGPIVVLEAVSDPGNVGTIIRTADAAGAAGVVLLPDCVDVHNGKVVRSTAGSLFHLPIATGQDLDEVVAAARAAGRTLAVATGDGAVDLFEAARGERVGAATVWLIGSEAHGVSAGARAAADVTVAIPMTGRAESLNAAVATAAVLYVCAFAKSRLHPAGGRMTD